MAIPIARQLERSGQGEEATLLRRARQGESEALSRLLLPHQPLLFRLCLSQRLAPCEAEDAVQEALIRAVTALKAGKFGGRASLRTWLIRIALNACRDLKRRERPSVPLVEGTSSAAFEADALLRVEAQAALASLSPRQRAAFLLRDVEEWSRAEAAQALGVTPRRIDYELAQARSALSAWRETWTQSE